MPKTETTKGSDALARLMYRKVNVVDHHFAQLKIAFEDITRTESKLAGRWEQFARTLEVYGEEETTGVHEHLRTFAQHIRDLQQHRLRMVAQMTARVSGVLSEYPQECKNMRDEVDDREKLKGKADSKVKALEKARTRDPSNVSSIKKARIDLTGAKSEVDESERTLINSMVTFEQKKLDDIQDLLIDLLESQMTFSCRTLETFTGANHDLAGINSPSELQEVLSLRKQETREDETSEEEED